MNTAIEIEGQCIVVTPTDARTLAEIPLRERHARAAARYALVDATLPATLPPLTRAQAEKVIARIYHHFHQRWRKERGLTATKLVPNARGRARSVWLSAKPTAGHYRGWGRLIHDASHILFRRQYPRLKPHDPRHGQYELDVAGYVVSQGWLDGKLAPKPRRSKPRLSIEDRRARELALADAAIKRWTTKAKRAATALKKLERKRKRLAAQVGGAP